jgi:hypothetical protein
VADSDAITHCLARISDRYQHTQLRIASDAALAHERHGLYLGADLIVSAEKTDVLDRG